MGGVGWGQEVATEGGLQKRDLFLRLRRCMMRVPEPNNKVLGTSAIPNID